MSSLTAHLCVGQRSPARGTWLRDVPATWYGSRFIGALATVPQSLLHIMTHVPTLNITLSLPQDEIDAIRAAAGSESVASLTARALRHELRAREAAQYAAWNESLPQDVRADLDAWDAAPMPGWDLEAG